MQALPPPSDRFSVRAEAARVTVADAREAARALKLKNVTLVSPLSGGFSNANFRIEAAGGPFVLRFVWNGRTTGERECGVLKRCRLAGIRVPEVLGFQSDALRTVAVLSWIEGLPFATKLERWREGQEAVFFEAGRQLALTHAIRFSDSGLFDAEVNLTHKFRSFPEECLQHITQSLEPGGRGRGRLGAEKAEHFLAMANKHWDVVRDAFPGACLTHCDFNPKNLIVGSKNEVTLIDWEFAMAADPLIDLGNFFRFAEDDYPKTAREEFIRGYQDAGGRLPKNWDTVARLIDLTAIADFLAVEADYQKTFHTARIIVDRTLAHFAQT